MNPTTRSAPPSNAPHGVIAESLDAGKSTDSPASAAAQARGAESDIPSALSEEQKTLVRENIGLVAVHLKRGLGDLSWPRHDREWDDLFQEGCLGLMRAAQDFDPQGRVPFAAYALSRIHVAVTKALRTQFSMVSEPPCPRRRGRSADPATRKPHRPAARAPRRSELAVDKSDPRGTTNRHAPDASGLNPSGSRLGDRVREKYERAVLRAGEFVGVRTTSRSDRDVLVNALIRDRLMVPDQESRRGLRQIARETNSSFARVAQCAQRLAEQARRLLRSDPEFDELRRLARGESAGLDAPLDDDAERQLREVSIGAIRQRLTVLPPARQAAVLQRLFRRVPHWLMETLCQKVISLSAEVREELFAEMTAEAAAGHAPAHPEAAMEPSCQTM